MTAIEWTDRTWNPVTGCDRTSPGCDNCYALTMAKRLKAIGSPRYQNDGDPRTSGPGFGVTCHADVLGQPLRWRKPSMVFVNSMSDLFHADVPATFVGSVWNTMALAEQHTFQVLTKRPQLMATMLRSWENQELGGHAPPGAYWRRSDLVWCGPLKVWPLPNVWLGVSVESDRYTFRVEHLRETPAAVRFISAEPLLGPLPSLDLTGIDWVIIGAESGNGARSMNNDWALEIIDKADAAGCAVFVKQLSGGVHAVKDPALFPLTNLRRREYPPARWARVGERPEDAVNGAQPPRTEL